MKIVHVSTLFFPFVGGLEIAVQKVAEEQARLGHEVHVVTSDAYAEDRPRVKEELTTIIRVSSWKNPYPYLIVPREIPKNVLKNANVVIGWGHTYYFVYRIVKEAKKIGRPVGVYFIGVDYLKHHYNPLFRMFGYQYQKMLTRRLTKVVDIAFTTNHYEGELLRDRYGLDPFIVPHGVDEIYLKLPNMAKKFRDKYAMDGGIITYIGRIHPTKGVDLLIRAFEKIVKELSDVTLVIAGAGSKKYLEKCIRRAKELNLGNKIKFLGFINEEDKIALIDASDVIVLPTKHYGESYPLLINEVIARNKLLVLSRHTLASIWLEKAKCNNITFTNLTVDELAKTIANIFQLYEHIQGSNRCRDLVATWKIVAQRLTSLISSYL
jgi:glycosyltransferase involved in cell wall biosynthesis